MMNMPELDDSIDFVVYQNDKDKTTFIYDKLNGWIAAPQWQFNLWQRNVATIRRYPDTFKKLLNY
jgi:hypothetical protein